MAYIGNVPTQSAFVTDLFSGDGTTTAFTMSVSPANPASILVFVSGVGQDPTTYSVSGRTLNFSAAPPSATGNISVRYLGIPASGVTTTAYRTITEYTATAGQTTFTPPSYTVGFINVFRNGVMLGSADFTATNGTSVVLASGASAGDLVSIESFYVSSVLNAIPATANAVNTLYIADSAITTAKIASGAVIQADLAAGVAGNGPAFSAYRNSQQLVSNNTFTKLQANTEEFDTASCYDSSTNYRFTPNVAGYYQVNGNIYLGTNGSLNGTCLTSIFKNGSRLKDGVLLYGGGAVGQLCFSQVSALIYLNGSTDYIELYGLINGSGSPFFESASGGTASYFQAFLARAA